MIDTAELNELNAQQLRDVVQSLLGTLQARDAEITFKQALIDKLTHEMAVLKRLKFAAKSKPSTPSKGVCWTKRSMPIWRHLPGRSSNSRQLLQARATSSSQSASRCQLTCRAARFATSPSAPPALAAAS